MGLPAQQYEREGLGAMPERSLRERRLVGDWPSVRAR